MVGHPHTKLLLFKAVLRPPRPTLFPYTTLFRSHEAVRLPRGDRCGHQPGDRRAAARRCRDRGPGAPQHVDRSEEHTSELQSRENLVCRLLLEKKNTKDAPHYSCISTTRRCARTA